MPTINEYLEQEIILEAYKQLRNAPRDTINFGVRPNAIKCLAEYATLQTALSGGGDGVPDISSLAESFAAVTGPVTPFIALLQYAMQIVIMTPMIVDQAAAAQGMIVPPFGVDISTPLDPAEYAATLQAAAAAIVATGQAMQQMQGGGE
jgi:hypothetical protein